MKLHKRITALILSFLAALAVPVPVLAAPSGMSETRSMEGIDASMTIHNYVGRKEYAMSFNGQQEVITCYEVDSSTTLSFEINDVYVMGETFDIAPNGGSGFDLCGGIFLDEEADFQEMKLMDFFDAEQPMCMVRIFHLISGDHVDVYFMPGHEWSEPQPVPTPEPVPDRGVNLDGLNLSLHYDRVLDIGINYQYTMKNCTNDPIEGHYALLSYSTNDSGQIHLFDLSLEPGAYVQDSLVSNICNLSRSNMLWIKFDSKTEREQFFESAPLRESYGRYLFIYEKSAQWLSDNFGI